MNNLRMRMHKRGWLYTLIAFTLVGILVNVAVFYPGFMSNDSLAYLYQAKGWSVFDSLHPIFTSLLWGMLIHLTGHESAMLLLQVVLLWGSSLLIALYIYTSTKSKKFSLAGLFLPLLPYVFNISGVLWSDVLYAGLMFFATSLALWIGRAISVRWRIALLAATLLVLMMAVMVRYNTIPATIPIIIAVLYRSKLFTNKFVMGGLTVGVLIIAIGVLVGTSTLLHVKDRGLINGPRLDDIVNLASRDSIESGSLSSEQRDFILGVYDCAANKHIDLDVIHNCVARGDEAFDKTIAYTQPISVIWKQTIMASPANYLVYRVDRYVFYLFPPAGPGYIWHEGIDSNEFGITVRNPRLASITGTIVNNLFYRYLSFLYAPWFWLGASTAMGIFVLRRKWKGERAIILALSISSLLVIASYFPTGATIDYRYVYWSAIASSLAGLLILTEQARLKSRIAKAGPRKKTTTSN